MQWIGPEGQTDVRTWSQDSRDAHRKRRLAYAFAGTVDPTLRAYTLEPFAMMKANPGMGYFQALIRVAAMSSMVFTSLSDLDVFNVTPGYGHDERLRSNADSPRTPFWDQFDSRDL